MRMRKDTPLEVVVRTFQSLNIPFVLFTSLGKLAGIMTRVSGRGMFLCMACVLMSQHLLARCHASHEHWV